jgi:hypothetical protein
MVLPFVCIARLKLRMARCDDLFYWETRGTLAMSSVNLRQDLDFSSIITSTLSNL